MLLGHRKIIRTQGLKRIKLLERNGQTSSSAVSPSSTPFRQRSSAILNQEKLSPHQGQVKMVSSALPAFGKVSMGSTPPVSRMYKRHALANEDYDDDDMDEDADPADTTAAPMDWQPFDEDLHVSRTDVPDVDMQDDTINKRAEIKLRPAVFNPEDEWHLAAYGMKGLDGLFAKGVTLDDVRMDDAASHTSKVNPFTHLVAAALASVLCGTIFWLYNSPRVAVNGSLFTSNSDAWSWPFKRAAR